MLESSAGNLHASKCNYTKAEQLVYWTFFWFLVEGGLIL